MICGFLCYGVGLHLKLGWQQWVLALILPKNHHKVLKNGAEFCQKKNGKILLDILQPRLIFISAALTEYVCLQCMGLL